MQHAESQSTTRFARVEDEPATTQFVRAAPDRDDTVPSLLYSSPYDRLDIEAIVQPPRERAPVAITAAANLVASDRTHARSRARRAATRPMRRAHVPVSPWAMLAAALVGASVFVLGVVAASLG